MPLWNPLVYKYKGLNFAGWTPIVQNVWYPVQWNAVNGLRGFLKIFSLAVNQTNTAANPADIEVRITIDNNAPLTLTIAGSVSAEWHQVVLNMITGTLFDTDGDTSFFSYADGDNSESFECSYFLIEVRQTSAIGLAPTLNVRYAVSFKES